MLKKLIVLILYIFCLSFVGSAQSETVTVMQTVKVKNEKQAEAVFYYENNWKVLRRMALQKGYIHSFEFILTEANENADFDIILITRYTDQNQYDKGEERFQELIKARGAVKLKNDLKPDDFRQIVFVKIGKSHFVTASEK